MITTSFPATRLRRTRLFDWSRRLVAENCLTVSDLILPVFVHDKPGRDPIESMPGIYRHSIESLRDLAQEAATLGIPALAIFPATPQELKTEDGREALNANNLVCLALAELKSLKLNLGLLCDVALDPYTNHGHDGVLADNGTVDNDRTVEILCKQAVVQAKAGCNVICPSDMMDGRVGAIRRSLDAHGFVDVAIMSYAAKYASAFYGPFRDAIGSQALVGRDALLGYRDKSNYQMDPRNGQEALREVAMDIAEGADYVMVKPGMPYLDIVHQVSSQLQVPTFVYQVSGEYAMLADAAAAGHLDRKRAILESLMAFKRAGAQGIFTYFAIEAANSINSHL